VVYAAEHPSLALLESLVNVTGSAESLPREYQLLKINVPGTVVPAEVDPDHLPLDWQEDLHRTGEIGDAWLAQGKSALLKIPAAPSPESWNYLLNPLHPDAREIKIESCRWISYDRRLFGIREK